MAKVNVLIAQGGGPTSVINGSLASAIREFNKYRGDVIGSVFVALYGAAGILNEDILDVSDIDDTTLDGLEQTVCAAAGSSREKLNTEKKRSRVLDVFDAHNIHLFALIGGGDTASTVREINKAAEKRTYGLVCHHILKTVDNDGYGLFSPGWGTAGRWVRDATMSLIKEVDAMGGIQLLLSMGRDSGWITAMSAHAFFAEGKDKSNIQRIYTPETGFSLERFAHECIDTYKNNGKMVINVSEGVQEDGCPVSLTERLAKEEAEKSAALQIMCSNARIIEAMRSNAGNDLTPSHIDKLILEYSKNAPQNIQHDQHGQVAYGEIRTINQTDWLAEYLQSAFSTKHGRKIRVRGNSLYYTGRCPLYISSLDLLGALRVGEKAAQDALAHVSETGVVNSTYGASVVIGGEVISEDMQAECIPLEKMVHEDTGKGIQYKMPEKYMQWDGPTNDFLEYSKPLIECEVIHAESSRFIDFTDDTFSLVDKKLSPFME